MPTVMYRLNDLCDLGIAVQDACREVPAMRTPFVVPVFPSSLSVRFSHKGPGRNLNDDYDSTTIYA